MVKLFIVQGDTAIFQLVLKNPDCSLVDLTDGNFPEITFTLKRSNTDTDEDAIFQGTLTSDAIVVVGLPTDGTIQVTVPHSATVQLRFGCRYYWDVQLVDSTGQIFTPSLGTLYVVNETTDAS